MAFLLLGIFASTLTALGVYGLVSDYDNTVVGYTLMTLVGVLLLVAALFVV